MNSEDFCNWLKGYLELANPKEIREREIGVILEHLNLVKKTSTSNQSYSRSDVKFGIPASLDKTYC